MRPGWLLGLLLSLMLPWSAFAAQETLQVGAVSAVANTNGWTLVAGASKPVAVNTPDDDATTYIHSTTTSGTVQRFVVNNTTSAVESGATINFVRLSYRVQRAAQSTNFAVRAFLGTAATTDLQTTGQANTGSTSNPNYTTQTTDYTSKPGGGGWTKADVDDLEIDIRNTQGRRMELTTFEVIVDYTNPAVTQDQVGWWKFDEASGTTVLDSSGNARDGQLCDTMTCPSASGPTRVAPGKVGLGAISMDGTDTDYVDVPHNAAFNAGSAGLSIAFWYKPTSLDTTTNVGDILISKADWNSADSFSVSFYNGGGNFGNALRCAIGRVFDEGIGYSVVNFSVDSWYHIVCLASSAGHAIHINGNATPAASNATTHTTMTNTSVLRFGRLSPFADGYGGAHGTFDDVRIFNYRLSTGEIANLYQLGLAARRSAGVFAAPW